MDEKIIIIVDEFQNDRLVGIVNTPEGMLRNRGVISFLLEDEAIVSNKIYRCGRLIIFQTLFNGKETLFFTNFGTDDFGASRFSKQFQMGSRLWGEFMSAWNHTKIELNEITDDIEMKTDFEANPKPSSN